jgi:thymidylate synthase (FAD)
MIKATYIDHMGSDLSVVNAARVSFGKVSNWLLGEEGNLVTEDAKLISYLAKHGHYSPFGHCFASFHIKAPIFVARQLVKHEYLRMNEISRRYVDSEPEFYAPEVWRGRSKDKKQGSSDKEVKLLCLGDNGEQARGLPDLSDSTGEVSRSARFAYRQITKLYKEMLASDIAPEMARMVLPQSMYTEWYWSGSMDAFANMCNLRLKEDTQYETRLVAQQIDKVMREIYPVSWSALVGEETK